MQNLPVYMIFEKKEIITKLIISSSSSKLKDPKRQMILFRFALEQDCFTHFQIKSQVLTSVMPL